MNIGRGHYRGKCEFPATRFKTSPSALERNRNDGCARVLDSSRYGTVDVTNNRVIGFVEKTGSETPGLVNDGIYVFKHSVPEHISEEGASVEKDVFPRLIQHGVYAQEQHGTFIDIGTPADYPRAQQLLQFS
jgi:NDP-sugar pyrophosphorylase family protein